MSRHGLAAQLVRACADAEGGSSDFDLDPGYAPQRDAPLRPASVLIGIIGSGDTASVVLTRRSAALRHHPGQIAFPGGRQDASDASPEAAALREAHEEIGLDPANVTVLGTLPCHETVTGFRVTPVLATITRRFDYLAEIGEVAEVFEVPLAHMLDTARYRVEERAWRGRMRPYFIVPYGPFYIWGATARMLRVLADRMERCAD